MRNALDADCYSADDVVEISPDPIRSERVRRVVREESAAPVAEGEREAAGPHTREITED
jgi:hypothetical protein